MNEDTVSLTIETLPKGTTIAPSEAESPSQAAEVTAPAATSDGKTFTQEELEKQIADRLRRERKNNGKLDEIKGLLRILRENGLLKSTSYADMAKELRTLTLSSKNKSVPSDLCPVIGERESVDEQVTVPSDGMFTANPAGIPSYDEMSDKPSGESAAETVENGQATPFSDVTLGDLYTLGAAFPERHVADDLLSPAFRLFAEGRRGDIKDVYDAFVRFKDTLAPASPAVSAAPSAQPRTRQSSTFGGVSASDGGSYYLTARQKEIAKAAGLSFREYAEMLESVPHPHRADKLC